MKLVEVKPLGNFEILLVFEDGQRRIFHGKNLWKDRKRFLPLKDINYFNQVEIYECLHTIGWPGPDDLQISPEWLWRSSTPIVNETLQGKIA